MTTGNWEELERYISRGPYEVRTALADYLSINLPIWLTKCRAAWGLSFDDLPTPKVIYKYERDAIDQYPMTVLSVSRSSNGGMRDLDAAGSEEFPFSYNVSVYTWVNAEDTEQDVLKMRDLMSTAMRWCLLEDKTFANDYIDLRAGTMTEDYTTATKVKGSRWIAAFTHSFTVALDETLVLDQIAVAETIVVDGILVRTTDPIPVE